MASSRGALVVATGRYDDAGLRRLRSPAQDASALAEVLSDPAIGAYEVVQVVDEPHYVVAAAMEDFFADRRLDDLLLLHLSCHGVKDDDGRLYFAASDTRRRRLASSAVSAGYLNDLMDECRARSIVVLLDCCYSGAFLTGAKGDDDVHLKERLSGHGRAVLTASNAIEYAWEGDELSGQAEQSLFTAAIIDGLATGDADRDRDGVVSIEDLHTHVYESVRDAKRTQTPLLWMFGIEGALNIAQNPHPSPFASEAPASEPAIAGEGSTPAAASALHTDGRWRRVRGLPRSRRRGIVAMAVALAVGLVAAVVSLSLRDGGGPVGAGAWSPEAPAGIAVEDNGDIYAAESTADRVAYLARGTAGTLAGGNDDANDDEGQGDGGPATSAALAEPLGLALSADGDLYIADHYHARVRRVGDDGTITRFAGNGHTPSSGDGGPASQAQLTEPYGVAIGPDRSVYISDVADHRVRRVGADGTITTVAGTGEAGFSGDGGPATAARLEYPTGLAVAADGTLYIADTSNQRVRSVTPDGTITTVAGTGEEGFTSDGVPAIQAALHGPQAVAIDPDGRLHIADTGNNRIRRVEADGTIVSVAGNGLAQYQGDHGPATSASLNMPHGIAFTSDGDLYIADTGNDRVRRVTPNGIITSL